MRPPTTQNTTADQVEEGAEILLQAHLNRWGVVEHVEHKGETIVLWVEGFPTRCAPERPVTVAL